MLLCYDKDPVRRVSIARLDFVKNGFSYPKRQRFTALKKTSCQALLKCGIFTLEAEISVAYSAQYHLSYEIRPC